MTVVAGVALCSLGCILGALFVAVSEPAGVAGGLLVVGLAAFAMAGGGALAVRKVLQQ